MRACLRACVLACFMQHVEGHTWLILREHMRCLWLTLCVVSRALLCRIVLYSLRRSSVSVTVQLRKHLQRQPAGATSRCVASTCTVQIQQLLSLSDCRHSQDQLVHMPSAQIDCRTRKTSCCTG